MTQRPRPLPISTTVARVERLTPGLVRVIVSGPELAGFTDPVEADSYVKVVFLHPDGDYARPIDPARIRAELPEHLWPRVRSYTVRAFDRERGELTLDFVVHGDSGLAGPWAAAARPGDEVLLLGPGGGYSPRPDAAWHLLAGDESALPAIAVALERIHGDAPVHAFIEVHGPEDEIELAAPAGARISWLHRGDGEVGSQLVEAVRTCSLPDGEGHAFVHGEAGFVKTVRRHLRIDRAIPLDQLSISGYWRTGVEDEKWRASKREWNRAVEESEAGAA